VSEWKRRLESTPSQLDEILNEYTSKNSDLEMKVREMQDEIRKKDSKYESELKQREERIVLLETSLQEARDSDEEARQERDSLREELTALSQAYSDLEQDYRRSQQSGPQIGSSAEASGGASTGEGSVQQQPQGEGSGQQAAGSTEVATLRADNARLRQDAKAADEWMAMAVERMGDMDTQNTALQQQVASLLSQLEGNQSTAEMERLLQEERAARHDLETRLSSTAATEQAIDVERARQNDLERELARANETVRQLEEQCSRQKDLVDRLDSALADVQTLEASRKDLEGTIHALEYQLGVSQQENSILRQERSSLGSTIAEDPTASNATVEALQGELQRVQAELFMTKNQDQGQMYRYEARIRELESRLDGGLGKYTLEDIYKRDEDIEQLQKANDDAQEWMAKAVERHQILSNQVSSLTHEKSTLASEVKHLSAKVASLSANNASAKLQEAEGSMLQLTKELEESRAELAARNEDIERLQLELQDASTKSSAELEQLREANARLMEETAQIESLIHERNSLQKQLQELESSASERHAVNTQQHVQGNSERVSELEAEMESLRQQLKSSEQEALNVISQWQERYRSLEQTLQQQMNQPSSSPSVEQSKIVEGLEIKVQSLEMQLADQEREANVVITRWQESYTALENNRNDLETELQSLRLGASAPVGGTGSRVEELEKQVRNLGDELVSQKKEASDVIAQWQESYNALEASKSELEAQLVALQQEEAPHDGDSPATPRELSGTVRMLEEQLANAEKATSEWKETCERMETEKIGAEKRVQELQQEKEEVVASAHAKTEASEVIGLEDFVDKLESEMEVARGSISNLPKESEEAEEHPEEDQVKAGSGTSTSRDPDKQDASEANDSRVKSLERELQEQGEAVQRLESELQATRGSSGESDDHDMHTAELEAKVRSLEEQLSQQETEANSVIAQWQQSYTAMESAKTQMESELEMLKQQSTRNDGLIDGEQSLVVDEYEAKLTALEKEAEDQEAEANRVIAQWQESYTAMEARKKELESEIELLKQDMVGIARESEESGADPSLIADYEAKLDTLQEELLDQETQSNEVSSNWQGKVERLESELEAFRAGTLSEPSPVVEEDTPTVAELQGMVDNLEQQLIDHQMHSNVAVAQWKQRFEELESMKNIAESELEQLKKVALQHSTAIEEYEAKVKALESQMEDQENQANEVIAQWQERLQSLESQADDREPSSDFELKIRDLENQLKDQEAQANAVIAEWQTSYAALETAKNELESELATLRRDGAPSSPPPVQRDLEPTDGEADAESTTDHSVAAAEYEAKLKVLETELHEQEAQANDVINQWQERVQELESELAAAVGSSDAPVSVQETPVEESVPKSMFDSKVEELDQASEAIIQWQERCEEVQSELEQVRNSLVEKATESEGVSEDQTAKIRDLESKIESLEQQLAVQHSQANAIVGQWSENYAALESSKKSSEANLEQLKQEVVQWEENYTTLSADKEKLAAEVESLNNKLNDSVRTQSRIKELEDELSYLEDQAELYESTIADRDKEITDLQKKAEELQDIETSTEQLKEDLENSIEEVKLLQERLSVKEAEMQSLVESGKESEAALATANEVVETLRADVETKSSVVASLELQLTELESQAEQERADAEDAIAAWESGYQELQSKLAESSVPGDAMTKDQEEIESLKCKVESMEKEFAVAEEKIAELRRELEKQSRESEENARIAKEAHESAVRHLEADICAQEAEANEVIVEWESRCNELDASLATTIDLIENEIGRKRQWVKSLLNCGDEAEAVSGEGTGDEEDLSSMLERLQTSLSHYNVQLENAIDQLSNDRKDDFRSQIDTLTNEKASLERERDDLRTLLRDLQDELREADDAMQLHITNEISDKATEIAAGALRQQVGEMRSRIEIDRNTFREERAARFAAEQEAEQLRADLAALLGLSNSPEMRSEINYRAVQAREKFQRKERSEIEELKEALSRSLDELAVARAAESAAEELASKANLQASVYEQEVLTNKAELKQLTEKLDEMRDAESTKCEAMEYRISTLQNDQDVLRRQHASQMEKLQNEVNYISMERDRLFQSLKDSERSKEALLRAKSGREAATFDDDEVAKLRLEKAQLLVASSDEGAKVERRLREARAAEQSSAEADVILERELRIAAEKALENVRLEMAELRSEGGAGGDAHALALERARSSELGMELESLRMEIDAISVENSSLRDQLEASKREAREKTDRLSQECRLAKTRASQLEREGRQEAEIRAEVSRLHAQSNGAGRTPYRWERENPAHDHGAEEIAVAHLYDIIEKQKQSIEEERAVYSKLLNEHDDLLALLAQQDVIRKSLKTALVKTGGDAAVAVAMREAQEEAVTLYGSSFVDLT